MKIGCVEPDFMNIGDISVIISVLAGMVAIPFAASTVSVADDYKYGLATVLNSTPEFATNSSSAIPSLMSKTVSDEGIKYSYRTPYGEFAILISPEKFEETLLKAGKKVSSLQSSSEQVWELSLPKESLVINHSSQKIVETYRNLDGYLRITKENGWTSQDKSGTASEEELQSGMLRLEKEMNGTVSLMKNMSGEILGTTKIEITGVNASAEWVEIKNNKLSSIDMTSWRLEDNATSGGSVNAYNFPQFVLNAGSMVRVYSIQSSSPVWNETCSKGSIPSQGVLCWNKSSVWGTHDVATLMDTQGTVISTFIY